MVSYTNSEGMKQQYDLNSLQKPSKVIKKPPQANNGKQPKVYQVKPIHFRELVQQLTGVQQFRRATLQSVAPPPLPVNSHHLQFQPQTQTQTQTQTKTRLAEKQEVSTCKVEQDYTASISDANQKSFDKAEGWEGMTELNMSPNFQAWFNFAMLSPGPAHVSN